VAVGRERLRQILPAPGISFQRTRTWKESTDPDREAKLDRIEYVTSTFPDRCFGFDQFGPLSIRPVHDSAWAGRKRHVLLPATYHRTHAPATSTAATASAMTSCGASSAAAREPITPWPR